MPDSWTDKLDQAVNRRYDELVALRRHLHQNPEPSGEEQQTSLHLYQLLDKEGFQVRMGPEGRGVVADFPAEDGGNGEAGGRFALRGDIDALRIHDAKQVEYCSKRPGLMHACGHDAHTAIVFGALACLNDLARNGDLPWDIRVRGVFQPAEETCRGAKEMIGVGALEGVDAILAAHVDPYLPVGQIGLRDGVLTANCDDMLITVTGRGGHAARPHETSDPIAAAAQLISALYLFIPRATDSQDAVVVTIGQILGGDTGNVIPEQVVLKGTVRTLDRKIRQQTFDHIRRLADGVYQIAGARCDVEFGLGSGSIDNNLQLTGMLRSIARDVLGAEGIFEIPRPSMGSEDFAYYLDHVPGAMFRLGCASDTLGGSPLHSPTFDIDEKTLCIGAQIMARAVIDWFNPHHRSSSSQHEQSIGK